MKITNYVQYQRVLMKCSFWLSYKSRWITQSIQLNSILFVVIEQKARTQKKVKFIYLIHDHFDCVSDSNTKWLFGWKTENMLVIGILTALFLVLATKRKLVGKIRYFRSKANFSKWKNRQKWKWSVWWWHFRNSCLVIYIYSRTTTFRNVLYSVFCVLKPFIAHKY